MKRVFEQGTLEVILFSVDMAVSLFTLCIAALITKKQPKMLRMPVFQTLVALQAVMVFRGAIEVTISSTFLTRETECRVLVFLALSLALLPEYLCDFCLIYIQMTLIYRMSVRKKWPTAVLATVCVLPAVVPPAFILFLSPSTAGISSFCEYGGVPNHRLFVFKWLVFNIWILLAGVLGIVSISMTIIHIYRTSAMTKEFSEQSRDLEMPTDVVHKVTLVNRTLVSVVWFPVTPIVSLYFTVFNSTLRYIEQRNYDALDTIDTVFQFLQAWGISLAFFANPPVRRFIKDIWVNQHKQCLAKYSPTCVKIVGAGFHNSPQSTQAIRITAQPDLPFV